MKNLLLLTLIAVLLAGCASPTQAPALPAPAAQPTTSTGAIALNMAALAPQPVLETVNAQNSGMLLEPSPVYRRVTLKGYPVKGGGILPVTSSDRQAQIFIFPTADMTAFNRNAAAQAAKLQALLAEPGTIDPMPQLPLINAKQVLHPQVRFLDFKNGKGVRFLAWYSQGMMKVSSGSLVYTYQGLTSDGKFYVSAVLPVSHPELPATEQGFAQNEQELKAYPDYITQTTAWLEQQPAGSFTPDLSQLDALVQSIEVK